MGRTEQPRGNGWAHLQGSVSKDLLQLGGPDWMALQDLTQHDVEHLRLLTCVTPLCHPFAAIKLLEHVALILRQNA